jgi:hypothetical protein
MKYLKVISIMAACLLLVGVGTTLATGSHGGKTKGHTPTTQYKPKPGDQGCKPEYWTFVYYLHKWKKSLFLFWLQHPYWKAEYSSYVGDGSSSSKTWSSSYPDPWNGYSPNASFNTVFGVNYNPKLTLLGALSLNGGGFEALARQAVAALLNSAHSGVNYGLTTGQIIGMVKKGFTTKKPDQITKELESFNKIGCSLDCYGSHY